LTQTGTSASTFTPSTTSNHLNSTTGSLARTYAYDAAGNTASYSNLTFTTNDRGRMSAVTVGSTATSYIYDAVGHLIKKTAGSTVTLLMYDEAGHLLGEYNSGGSLIQETIWMGDIPVATLRPNGSPGCTGTPCIFYVHTDQLNTPRKITQPSSNTLAWRWDTDPFGTVAVNQNPGGIGNFGYNLRFPGQYYQSETGLTYNYFRDYDPQTGRYLESDPIGLQGGSYSTYSYANSNPISNFDQLGLASSMAQQMFPQPATATSGQACPNSEDKQHCDELLQIDTDTCNAITKRRGRSAGESCHSSATQRYAACLRGKPLPPLNTWNNQVPGPTPNPVPPTVPVIPLPSPVPILPMPPVIEPIPIPIFP
jgi:RHS repeat-associated protein